MALLQIRNCPDELYEEIKAEAKENGRTIAKQALRRLRLKPEQSEAFGKPVMQKSNQELMKDLSEWLDRNMDYSQPHIDPVTFIREDRDSNYGRNDLQGIETRKY